VGTEEKGSRYSHDGLYVVKKGDRYSQGPKRHGGEAQKKKKLDQERSACREGFRPSKLHQISFSGRGGGGIYGRRIGKCHLLLKRIARQKVNFQRRSTPETEEGGKEEMGLKIAREGRGERRAARQNFAVEQGC